MGLLFMDGFDHYYSEQNNTYASQVEKWTRYASYQGITAPVHSGSLAYTDIEPSRDDEGAYNLINTGSAQAISNLVADAPQNTCIIGARYQYAGTGERSLFGLESNVGWCMIYLKMRPNGTLQPFVPWYIAEYSAPGGGGIGAYIGDPTIKWMHEREWYYIEFKVVITSGNIGTVTVRVNEEVWGQWTDVTVLDTRGPAGGLWNGGIWLSGGWSSVGVGVWDDLYVCDGRGAAPFNDFLGDVRIDAHYPTEDGAYTDFTPSTGTDHFELVNDEWDGGVHTKIPNADVDYNTTSTVGAIDTFVCEDFKAPGFPLLAIQHAMSHKKLDAGTAACASVIRQGTTNYVGTDEYSSEGSYYYALTIYTTEPATGTSWTEAGFNAMEIGYKKTI